MEERTKKELSEVLAVERQSEWGRSPVQQPHNFTEGISWGKPTLYFCVNILSLKKEGNPAICGKMDELEGHYVKWKK